MTDMIRTVADASVELIAETRATLGLAEGARLSDVALAVATFYARLSPDPTEFGEDDVAAETHDLWCALRKLRERPLTDHERRVMQDALNACRESK